MYKETITRKAWLHSSQGYFPLGYDNFHVLKFAFFNFWGYHKIDMNMTNFGLFILCHENACKVHIWPVSLSQNGAKMRKTNRSWTKCNHLQRWSGYISMWNFRHSSHAFWRKSRKPQIWHVSLNQNGANVRNINRPKSNLFWRWSGYISMSNFRPFKVIAIKRTQFYLCCHHKD